MSKDYDVYLKHAEHISADAFESYAYSLGYHIRVCPLDDYTEHMGFLPFNVRLNFIDRPMPYDSLLSGFEMYFVAYRAEDYDVEFNRLVGDCCLTLMMSIDGEDSLQELTALLFAGYLCQSCGGVLYDPQEDKAMMTLSEIEWRINAEKSRLMNEANRGRLRLHQFTRWN